MTRPLVATKLYVPRVRRGLVARPRLVDRLGGDARLTLVSAPAGFGKTTLLASWLGQADRHVAWLSLDASDDDPVSFWTGVVTAVHGAVGVGDRAQELLAAPGSSDQVLTVLLNELAEVPDEVWLVLDDYHLVTNQDIGRGVSFLVEHLPPHVHVVLSTRADPDLPLARWRVRGELAEIRAADLRFSSDEAAAYLDEATGVRLSAEQVRALADRTEGWIAALQLAAISLQGRDDVEAFIAGFAGDDRYVFDYLVEEVLANQPEPVRDFLLGSAVLDRLTGALCDAVLARDDAGAMLQNLERANLFLVALDDRREWYRYHQLFADVLRARLSGEQPELVPVLHRRASQWYQEHDQVDAAIGHALSARDFDRAAFLVEVAVPEIRRHRQEAKVNGWLSALPDDTVRRSPLLSVFSAAMSLIAGDLDSVAPRLDDAERALAGAAADGVTPWPDTEEQRTLPATIAIYRASVAQAQGDVAGTARHAQDALDLAGPHEHLARGGAAGFLGLAAWADGDVSRALETFGQAVGSLHAAGSLVDELSGTVVLAELWRTAGRPGTARALCSRALREAESLGEPLVRAAAELHVGAERARRRGRGPRGRPAAPRVRRLPRRPSRGDREPLPLLRGHGSARRGRRRPAGCRRPPGPGGAALPPGVLPRCPAGPVDPGPGPDQAGSARRGHGLGPRPSGDHHRPHRRTCASTTTSPWSACFSPCTVPMPFAARQPGWSACSTGCVTAAQASGRAGSLVEIRVLTSLAHEAQGHRQLALDSLTEAWTLTPEPEGYVQLFLDEGPPMLELLHAAERDRVVGHHARRVLALADPARGRPADADRPGIPPLAEPLSERELQVLRLLDSEQSGPEIARALFISPNTLRTHTKHVFTKLGVSSRREAVARARERGLLAPTDG